MKVEQQKKEFLKRAYNIIKDKIPLLFLATFIAIILTGQIFLSILFMLLIILIQFLYSLNVNKYQITLLCVLDNKIEIEVYKYNSLYLSGTFDIEKASFNKTINSSSKYGSTYKLKGQINEFKFEQIENDIWTNEKMGDLIVQIKKD